jgi:hypothetical protein
MENANEMQVKFRVNESLVWICFFFFPRKQISYESGIICGANVCDGLPKFIPIPFLRQDPRVPQRLCLSLSPIL